MCGQYFIEEFCKVSIPKLNFTYPHVRLKIDFISAKPQVLYRQRQKQATFVCTDQLRREIRKIIIISMLTKKLLYFRKSCLVFQCSVQDLNKNKKQHRYSTFYKHQQLLCNTVYSVY